MQIFTRFKSHIKVLLVMLEKLLVFFRLVAWVNQKKLNWPNDMIFQSFFKILNMKNSNSRSLQLIINNSDSSKTMMANLVNFEQNQNSIKELVTFRLNMCNFPSLLQSLKR